MVAPAKIETSGQRRSGPTANDATTTKKKPPRYRPRGFDDSEGEVIDVQPIRGVG